MTAISILEEMRGAFKLSNMTGRERVLYFVWIPNLFTEWQPEKYYNGIFDEKFEGECYRESF